MLRLFKQSTPVTNRMAIIDTAKHSNFTAQIVAHRFSPFDTLQKLLGFSNFCHQNEMISTRQFCNARRRLHTHTLDISSFFFAKC